MYIYVTYIYVFKNKNFWEELIAYFSLIWHRQHRKRHLQNFFIAVGTSLQNSYLETIEGYTDSQTLLWKDMDRIGNDASNNFVRSGLSYHLMNTKFHNDCFNH
jgi:hypothetical protein